MTSGQFSSALKELGDPKRIGINGTLFGTIVKIDNNVSSATVILDCGKGSHKSGHLIAFDIAAIRQMEGA